MNISNQIQELTLSFFKTIDAEIINNNGLYDIAIPNKYQNYFQKSKIRITFNEKVAEEHNCELIIPGSKTLFQIITNCSNKGPISVKSLPGAINTAIQYHFYVNFSGVKHHSQLFSITVDIQNMRIIEYPANLESIDLPLDFKLDSKKITPSFEIALNELKQNSSELKSTFINNANIDFETDLKLFISRYDDEIRELDNSITKKESTSNDFEKIKQYRFDTIDEIEKIEKEKSNLVTILQNKHQVNFDYNLVACEIILY
jgi:hypothetical protein